MRTLSRIYGIGPLGATPASALAQDDHRKEPRRETDNNRRYRDARHHDDHAWNDHKDQAYRMWLQQRHRRSSAFDRLNGTDQQASWDWRHDHSDAQLRINIR